MTKNNLIASAVLPDRLPPMLTRPETCAVARLSYTSIWKKIRSGEFPAAVNVAPGRGVCNRWVTAEVLAWVERQKISGKRQPFAGAGMTRKTQTAGA